MQQSNLRVNPKWMLLCISAAASTVFAQTPHFIGRTGCTTATCHGGLIGDGPIWHSSASRWESQDPHRAAGEALVSERSHRIVAALDFASTQNSEVFFKVLKDRCVSCHAPETIPHADHEPVDMVDIASSFEKQLSRGVGCESCHGPASAWEKLHTQLRWPETNRFEAAIGMRETASLLARVDNCSRCHVGSRTEDNVVRDMNHEMIAAGHPVLAFDMYRYENALAPHWENSRSAFKPSKPSQLVSRAAAARSRVLALAARFSAERAAASSQSPHLELSEFECAACHHRVAPGSLGKGPQTSGFPSWNEWLTVSNSLNFAVDQLRFDCFDLEKRIASIAKKCEQRSQQLLNVEQADPSGFLQATLLSVLNDRGLRAQIVADSTHARAWFDQIEIATHAASLELSEKERAQVEAILSSFRAEKLREVPGKSISARILTRVVCDASDIEKLCTELLSTTKE